MLPARHHACAVTTGALVTANQAALASSLVDTQRSNLSTGASNMVAARTAIAAALTGYVAAFYGMFQHWNIRTPRWLGYLIQRPEAHCEHHRLDVHAYNYGDLPIWDLLLGTFKNPVGFDGRCGFESPADRRLGAMLAFEDVHPPQYRAGSRAAAQGGRVSV